MGHYTLLKIFNCFPHPSSKVHIPQRNTGRLVITPHSWYQLLPSLMFYCWRPARPGSLSCLSRGRRGWPGMYGGRRVLVSPPRSAWPTWLRESGHRDWEKTGSPCVGRSPPLPAEKRGWGADGAGWTLQHAKSCQLLNIKTSILNGWLEHSAPS